MKKILLIVLVILTIGCLISCNDNREKNISNSSFSNNNEVVNTDIPKEKQEGTAGSNIPLKDNQDNAIMWVDKALMDYFPKTYGSAIKNYKIDNIKIYSSEEEKDVPVLKDMNLGLNEVAFEIEYELEVADGVDGNQFTAGTGEYSKETGWVTQKHGVGILKPVENKTNQYEIASFGTGF